MRRVSRSPVLAVLLCFVAAAATAGCGGNPTAPSPPTSSLVYSVPAGTGHGAASGNFTEANATFGASVRTTCVPNPTIAGSYCPSLMALVRPTSDSLCQLFVDPPFGQELTAPRAYPAAQRVASNTWAGFSLNCASGGTACNWSVGRFTLHELQANASGVVTRLHITFEQTCSNLDASTYGAGTTTGELWIVNGTRGFFDAI